MGVRHVARAECLPAGRGPAGRSGRVAGALPPGGGRPGLAGRGRVVAERAGTGGGPPRAGLPAGRGPAGRRSAGACSGAVGRGRAGRRSCGWPGRAGFPADRRRVGAPAGQCGEGWAPSRAGVAGRWACPAGLPAGPGGRPGRKSCGWAAGGSRLAGRAGPWALPGGGGRAERPPGQGLRGWSAAGQRAHPGRAFGWGPTGRKVGRWRPGGGSAVGRGGRGRAEIPADGRRAGSWPRPGRWQPAGEGPGSPHRARAAGSRPGRGGGGRPGRGGGGRPVGPPRQGFPPAPGAARGPAVLQMTGGVGLPPDR